ncbi:alpha/beta fold hydrolase [Ancylobacter lacus]|uniref:alpha/beta fold hydrolase n=1 Tax=Ancylobacter lacus TaxID=2579970 RepID=UPI001BCDE7B9|nr:alpha/beta hydrolase [Ancylobacter lacus]MBS7537999.1 alpha/beta fold hydrolase [Ancylobacter lacus]
MSEPAIAWVPGRDGARLRVRYLRQGRGLPVILVHGVGMALEAWEPQVAVLAANHEVIALDMPGHGGSSLPPADARLSDYSAQVVGLMDALGLSQAVVIGHSMGALVALDVALAHPGRVCGVVALNAVYCRSPEQRAAVEARAAALAEQGAGASHAAAVDRWFGTPVPPALADHAATVLRLLEACDPVGYARTYRLFATSDEAHRANLPSLAVPALFMTADGDPNSTPAMSQAMAAAVPLGRCEVLAGERHMMNLTAPTAVNAALLRFLDGLPAAPAARAARA